MSIWKPVTVDSVGITVLITFKNRGNEFLLQNPEKVVKKLTRFAIL